MKVSCQTCAKEFEATFITQTLEGVDIVYLECSCGQRYISYVADKEVKEHFAKTSQLLKRSQNQSLSFAQRKKAKRKNYNAVEENRRLLTEKKAKYQYLINQVID